MILIYAYVVQTMCFFISASLGYYLYHLNTCKLTCGSINLTRGLDTSGPGDVDADVSVLQVR